MIDGKLCAGADPGNYAVGSPYNADLVTGQAVELFLGGHWIPGHIASSYYTFDTSSAVTSTRTQSIGAYQLPNDDVEDTVTEASEESFPASDPPAWSATSDRSSEQIVNIANGYYFVADARQYYLWPLYRDELRI